jgi:Purple acid Phosphatase, N-terminal domain/Calcineurin-like phosphoesterase
MFNSFNSFTVLVVGVILASGTVSIAAPKYVRLSYMENASNSLGVAWTTTSGTAEAVVKYGTTKGSYPKSVTGKTTSVSTTLGTVSEVTLTGLTPNTTYYYRAGGSQGGFSPEYSFHTGPPQHPQCGKTKFAVFGDSRAESWEGDKGASNNWVTQSLAASKYNPDFFIHGGDIVYDGDNQKQWDHHLKATAPVSSIVPIMYTIGNHDTGPGDGDTANFNKIYHLPRASKALTGSGTEDHYYFTWGNAIFISLSSENFSGGSPKFKNQADWMDKVLTQNPKRWKFVTLHRPIYTHRIDIFSLELSHPPDEAGQNAALVPIINKHHVDIVFQSHNHFYERYAPSNCSNGGSTKPCPVSSFDKGTVHITTGGAGAFPLWCVLPFICPGPTSSTRIKASSDHHWLLFEIKDHTLTLKAINLQGKNIDTLTITKSVPAPDPCAALKFDGKTDMSVPSDGSASDGSASDGPVSDGPVSDALVSDGPTTPPIDSTSKDTQTGPDPEGGAADSSTDPPPGSSGGCSCEVRGSSKTRDLLWLPLVLGLFIIFTRKDRSS